MTTTAYCPQNKKQVGRDKKNILVPLRPYVNAHEYSSNMSAQLLTNVYNTRIRPFVGVSPFDLVLKRRMSESITFAFTTATPSKLSGYASSQIVLHCFLARMFLMGENLYDRLIAAQK